MSEDGVVSVSISSIKPYPGNPRKGDISAIAASLVEYGQYRPLVVSKNTNYILAGNHTWHAAKKLKWKQVAVTYVEVSKETEKRIVLADNRIHELGDYDNSMLLDLLKDMEDLASTGYDETDVDKLEGLFEEGEMFKSEPQKAGLDKDRSRIVVGEYRILIEQDIFNQWLDSLSPERKPEEIEGKARALLFLTNAPAVKGERSKKTKPEVVSTEQVAVIVGHEMAQIESLLPHSANPRQGDIGAIAKSLAVNGQYRPLTVNKSTMQILVGNHTWQAARALGWEKIAVTYIDVSDAIAQKIVLVDNRLADRGEFDDERLADLLIELDGKWAGTGYSDEDVDEVLQKVGRKEKVDLSPNVKVAIGEVAFKVGRKSYEKWLEDLTQRAGALRDEICKAIVEMLDLPSTSWVISGKRDRKRDE